MLKITWKQDLKWEVVISGSKNAILPVLWASLLLKWKVKLRQVPKIWDIFTFLGIIEKVWVKYKFSKDNKWEYLEIDSSDLKYKKLDFEEIEKIRWSVLLLSPFLYFFWKIDIPFPWWCLLWKRPIEAHINWLKSIWYKIKQSKQKISLRWKTSSWDIVLDACFWVTPTENLLIANVLREWITTIKCCAIEPHVINLIDFLRKAWAIIKIKYNHTIIIQGVKKLKNDFDFKIISDYIESWTYMIIAALCSKEYLTIKNARINDLYVFIQKMKEAWVKFRHIWNDTMRVYRADKLENISIQTNIFPWFPTDLQSPFAVLMTQAKWINKIHEVLFESRLNFLVELEKMWANIAIQNPHEWLIFGKSLLRWTDVTSWDLRAWAAMIVAWLIASGVTTVTNVEYIYRWYENFVEKLKNLGANIEKV